MTFEEKLVEYLNTGESLAKQLIQEINRVNYSLKKYLKIILTLKKISTTQLITDIYNNTRDSERTK